MDGGLPGYSEFLQKRPVFNQLLELDPLTFKLDRKISKILSLLRLCQYFIIFMLITQYKQIFFKTLFSKDDILIHWPISAHKCNIILNSLANID